MTADEKLHERRAARIASGRAAFERITNHEHFRDWLAIADALAAIRDIAMEQVHTQHPQGPPYRKALKAISAREPWTNKLDTATKTACYWLIDNLAAVQAWRELLSFKERDAWNHPATVKRNYERTHIAKLAKAAGTPEPLSPLARARQLSGQLQEENNRLRRELAHARNDGSLFSLRSDSADMIGRVIVAHVSDNKAEAIAKSVMNHMKARQVRKTHAG